MFAFLNDYVIQPYQSPSNVSVHSLIHCCLRFSFLWLSSSSGISSSVSLPLEISLKLFFSNHYFFKRWFSRFLVDHGAEKSISQKENRTSISSVLFNPLDELFLSVDHFHLFPLHKGLFRDFSIRIPSFTFPHSHWILSSANIILSRPTHIIFKASIPLSLPQQGQHPHQKVAIDVVLSTLHLFPEIYFRSL